MSPFCPSTDRSGPFHVRKRCLGVICFFGGTVTSGCRAKDEKEQKPHVENGRTLGHVFQTQTEYTATTLEFRSAPSRTSCSNRSFSNRRFAE